MWRPMPFGFRATTTSACVGWDGTNIENQRLPRKTAQATPRAEIRVKMA